MTFSAWPSDNQLNIGHACTRRQCDLGRSATTALRWVSADGTVTSYSFAQLEAESNKVANALRRLGIGRGDVVALYANRAPELFFCALGALKLQAVICFMFANIGDEALRDRLTDCAAKLIVTRKSLLKKVASARGAALRSVVVLDAAVAEARSEGTFAYVELMRDASPAFEVAPTGPDVPSVLHYTSGSTGKPKGVLHVHGAVRYQQHTATEVLGLREGDVYWCTADQAWVTGTTYGLIAPWSLGVTQVQFGGGYDAEAWLDVLQKQQVTVWYTAPTALRMLMREPRELFSRFGLPVLERVFSVGEPLNPEAIKWAREVLGKPVFDTWFQTETGGIMIANRPGLEVRVGSMGKPVTGIEPVIVGDDNLPVPDGAPGHLCLRTAWPSMFVQYLNAPSAYAAKFVGNLYRTGDTAYRDRDGYFWFQGRSDDVINTAGHLVSPFEVESALLEAAEVAESGVIGAPDPVLFEKVVAFVALRDGAPRSRETELKLRLHVANRVSSVAAPQQVVFVDEIPKNNSGKIMRRVLKAWYLGQESGDTSTMPG